MQFLDELISLIDTSIKDDATVLITAGDIIKDGFDVGIDNDRKIIKEAHSWIADYQLNLIEETQINTLKIKFTNNSGYFIEIPKTQTSKVPDYFIGKQTLTQSSRYSTSELQEFEKKLFAASSDLYQKEYDVFIGIRDNIIGHFNNLYDLSRKVSYMDFLSNGALISTKRAYRRPNISSKYKTEIIAGKHPVISEKEKVFIDNDMVLGKDDFIHIITGPNMGGKSTYLRQNALLILMAHMGYDIPCKKADIGLTDKIFSRVGSGDNLFLGQSTFMVEMQEISYILRHATSNSFIIIDEIGRGTSTYDGMSLAWSILKYSQNSIKAKTLFATHYHEIIDHANELKGVSNYSVAVGENNDELIFLRKVIPGGIKKSYGIEVAKLAGIPQKVLDEARKMMLDMQNSDDFKQLSLGVEGSDIPAGGLTEKEKEDLHNYGDLCHSIESLDINNISPLEGLKILMDMQQQVKKSK